MHIDGSAGTGKSYLIDTVADHLLDVLLVACMNGDEYLINHAASNALLQLQHARICEHLPIH